jgi:hypothetical protein
LILLASISISAFAQKIKYKDVFTLLSTRQYEAAEPFLKKFIAENNDNPNAFLYMGIIYHEKSLKGDILRSAQEVLNHMDSAIYFYDKAYKSVDERELKRNKDYYAMYFRRDLRTGEYGVKLSDVQFEIEKSTDAMKERIDKVKMVNHYFTQAEQLYKRSAELFATIQSSFGSEKELYLRSDEETLKLLGALAVRFDSCSKAFEHYKVSLSNITKAGYNQTWDPKPVKDFKKDGLTQANLYDPNPHIWDYKNFAENTVSVVTKEIAPIREKLVKYDIEINKLRERLATDSVSVKSDLTKLVDNLLNEKLQKFDEDPLPMNVLAMKVAKLEYQSTLVEHRKKRDSADVFFQLGLVQREMDYLNKLDSITSALMQRSIDEEAANYSHFVSNTYSSVALLKSYIRAEKEIVEKEKSRLNKLMELRTHALTWIIAGTDSIPLNGNSHTSYRPLLVEENKFTAGIKSAEDGPSKGYFCTITPSRRPDINIKFSLDSDHLANLSAVKSLATADPGNNIYFVLFYSMEKVDEKYPATVAKIYRSDGLSWSHNFAFDFMPSGLQYQPESADLLIKSDAELVVLLDKGGKVRE